MPYKIIPPPPPPVIKEHGPPKPPRVALDIKAIMKIERRQEYVKQAAEAKAAGVVLEPFIEFVEEEEDHSECEEADFLIRRTASFKCLAQVAMSSSSFFRSVEYNFPPVEDPGLEEALDHEDPPVRGDDEGVNVYLDQCKTYKIIPLKRVLRSFTTPYMNLKFYGIRKYQLKCLAEALRTNRYVEYLILQNNHLTPQMVDWLCQCLEDNTVLSNLILKCCNIGPLGAAKLGNHLVAMSITHLDLSYNNLGEEGMKKLKTMAKMHSLNSLNLSHNNLTPGSAMSLERVLLSCRTLEVLDLSFNRLGTNDGYDILFNAVASSDHLRVFNLSSNGCCDQVEIFAVFTAYLQSTTTLEELDITDNRIPAGKFIRELRKGVVINKSLKILKIGNNPWTPAEAFPLAQLIKVSKTLEILDMDNIWFTKKVKKLLDYAKQEKRKLVIGGIYQDWVIKGPDWLWLMWSRIKALFAAPKRVELRQDFGDFLLTIPPEPTKVGQFEEHMMRKKYVEIVKDPDLVNAFYAIYKKDNKLEVGEMVRDYFHYFPRQLQHEDSSTKRSSKDVGSKVSMSSKGSKKSKSKSSLKGSKSSKTSVKKSKVSVVEPAEGGKGGSKTEGQREGSKVRISETGKSTDGQGGSLAPIQEEVTAT